MSGSVAAGGRRRRWRRRSGAGKRMTRPSVRVRRMSSWHRSSVRHAASPNLQIDFGILELGSILRSFVLFDGIELVLGGLVGRTPRGSLSLNPIAYLVYSLHSTPFFCTRLRHRTARRPKLSANDRKSPLSSNYRLPIRDDDDGRSAEGGNAAILNTG